MFLWTIGRLNAEKVEIRMTNELCLMKMADELYVSNRDDWRAWLCGNHESKKEVWLVYYRKQTGMPSIPYEDSVEEALCFGWVDSLIKKIDDERFARKFVRRTAKSTWSETNKKRFEKMMKEGRITESGLAIVKEAKQSGKWDEPPVSAAYRKNLIVPSYLEDALRANKKASENFHKLAESYRRNFIAWIDSTKREETRRRRIAESLQLLEKNQKLGMK